MQFNVIARTNEDDKHHHHHFHCNHHHRFAVHLYRAAQLDKDSIHHKFNLGLPADFRSTFYLPCPFHVKPLTTKFLPSFVQSLSSLCSTVHMSEPSLSCAPRQ